MSIEPRNLTAQMHYRAAGNPPSTTPESAISNCFPGLEFDFRNVWRLIFEGIEVHEARGQVIRAEGELSRLEGTFLVRVGDMSLVRDVVGPTDDEESADIGIVFLEWSNALADLVFAGGGEEVSCDFIDPGPPQTTETVNLKIRSLFARDPATDQPLAVIDEALAQPGELTQSLCSPWQNDYRECGCYYWAASRPDYVNVESTPQGPSIGNNWMAKDRVPKIYEPDNPTNPRQISYDDLFRNWESLLKFIVGGRDQT